DLKAPTELPPLVQEAQIGSSRVSTPPRATPVTFGGKPHTSVTVDAFAQEGIEVVVTTVTAPRGPFTHLPVRFGSRSFCNPARHIRAVVISVEKNGCVRWNWRGSAKWSRHLLCLLHRRVRRRVRGLRHGRWISAA